MTYSTGQRHFSVWRHALYVRPVAAHSPRPLPPCTLCTHSTFTWVRGQRPSPWLIHDLARENILCGGTPISVRSSLTSGNYRSVCVRERETEREHIQGWVTYVHYILISSGMRVCKQACKDGCIWTNLMHVPAPGCMQRTSMADLTCHR